MGATITPFHETRGPASRFPSPFFRNDPGSVFFHVRLLDKRRPSEMFHSNIIIPCFWLLRNGPGYRTTRVHHCGNNWGIVKVPDRWTSEWALFFKGFCSSLRNAFKDHRYTRFLLYDPGTVWRISKQDLKVESRSWSYSVDRLRVKILRSFVIHESLDRF